MGRRNDSQGRAGGIQGGGISPRRRPAGAKPKEHDPAHRRKPVFSSRRRGYSRLGLIDASRWARWFFGNMKGLEERDAVRVGADGPGHGLHYRGGASWSAL